MLVELVVERNDQPGSSPRANVFMAGEDDVGRRAGFRRKHELVLVVAPVDIVLQQGQVQLDAEFGFNFFFDFGEVVAAPVFFRRAGLAANGDVDRLLCANGYRADYAQKEREESNISNKTVHCDLPSCNKRLL